MKHAFIPAILMLGLATLACSFNVNMPNVHLPEINTTAGPTQTYTVNQPLPAGKDVTNVNLAMGAGTLEVASGADELLGGTIRYNVNTWKPELTQAGNTVKLTQAHFDRLNIPKNIINDWKIKLNDQAPINLEISAGAYQGNLDLSGIHLQGLTISDGASQADVYFNSPNPEEMRQLSYRTGASQVKLHSLANANFDEMTFDSGAGSYTLDYSGKLQRDAHVTIKTGVSEITILVPQGMKARVNNSESLNNINMSGTWKANGSTYETTGQGPLLTIDMTMGLGSLQLKQN